MKYAWVENNTIRDISNNPTECFHPDIAALYNIEIDDLVEIGWSLVDGIWVAPGSVLVDGIWEAPPAIGMTHNGTEWVSNTTEKEVVKILSPVEFKLCFTASERIAIKAARATDPVIDDFLDLIEDPRLKEVNLSLQSNKDAIDYLISVGVVALERRDAILSGTFV